MKILVTGAKGQLGSDLMPELQRRGHDVIGVDIDDMDITDTAAVYSVLRFHRPEAVIHCAAYTNVDAAEDAPELCYKINGIGTENIASACSEIDATMLYISTDYVFDGTGIRPWTPEDSRQPLNAYGQGKYLGELAVQRLLKRYFIVRISWVFGQNGKNFVKTMQRLAAEGKNPSVVADQIGSPTYTPDLSRLLADMIITDKYGCYHATNEGICSWYEFACEIFRLCGCNSGRITPISSDAYPVKAHRPKNSRMSKQKLEDNGFQRLPDWHDALRRYFLEGEESHGQATNHKM